MTDLYGIVESNAESAYGRLEELQAQGIPTEALSFDVWTMRNVARTGAPSRELVPEYTKMFPDGWDRFASYAHTSRIPTFELFVAGHDKVYVYQLNDTSLTDKIISLGKEPIIVSMP